MGILYNTELNLVLRIFGFKFNKKKQKILYFISIDYYKKIFLVNLDKIFKYIFFYFSVFKMY